MIIDYMCLNFFCPAFVSNSIYTIIYAREKNADLVLYTSFDEEIAEDCILCGQNTDDIIEYGRKITKNGITAHHFCLVT